MTDHVVIVTVEVNGLFLHLSEDGHVGYPMATSADATVGEFYLLNDPSDTICPSATLFALVRLSARPPNVPALVHSSAHCPPPSTHLPLRLSASPPLSALLPVSLHPPHFICGPSHRNCREWKSSMPSLS